MDGSITTLMLVLLLKYGSMEYGDMVTMCSTHRFNTSSGRVVVVNKDFPDPSPMANCSCRFESTEGKLQMVPGAFSHTNHNNSSHFLFRSNKERINTTSLSENISKMNQDIFSNATILELRIDPNRVKSYVVLSFVIIAFEGKIQVDCNATNEQYRGNSSNVTESAITTTSGENVTSPPILSAVANITSPALVILLLCVCVALLLIILVISIMLCCVMPRKQRAQIRKIRQSAIYCNDVTIRATDCIRTDSQLYSNPIVDRNEGAQQMNLLDANAAVPDGNTAYGERASGNYKNITPTFGPY